MALPLPGMLNIPVPGKPGPRLPTTDPSPIHSPGPVIISDSL